MTTCCVLTTEIQISTTASWKAISPSVCWVGLWVYGLPHKPFRERFPWEMKLAVNGTLTPIHDTTGIPEAVFNGTLDTFSPATLAKFRRRMCGGTEEVKHFLDRQPRRSVEELHEELKTLRQEVLRLPVPAFQWDKAIIGTEDRIFPSQNQLEAWQGTPVLSMNIAHYADLFSRNA